MERIYGVGTYRFASLGKLAVYLKFDGNTIKPSDESYGLSAYGLVRRDEVELKFRATKLPEYAYVDPDGDEFIGFMFDYVNDNLEVFDDMLEDLLDEADEFNKLVWNDHILRKHILEECEKDIERKLAKHSKKLR